MNESISRQYRVNQANPIHRLRFARFCLLFTCKQERNVKKEEGWHNRLATKCVCKTPYQQKSAHFSAVVSTQYFSQPFPATKLRLMYQFTRREESRYTLSNNTREIKSCGEVHRKIISLIISQDISLDVRLAWLEL